MSPFFNTIQSNLLTECIQDQFLKDYIKTRGIVNQNMGLFIKTHETMLIIVISIEYCPIVGNTLHRDTAYRMQK